MTFAELKAALEGELKGNQEVEAYLSGLFPVTAEKAKAFLDTEDGKRMLQPILDQYHSKGLETWKANNLDKLVQEKYDKEHPAEDERDQKIRDLEAKFELAEKARAREALKASALKSATEKGLPVEVIEHFVGEDEETTKANLSAFETAFKARVESEVDKVFKSHGIEPKKGGDPEPDKNKVNPWKKETTNLTMRARIEQEDPELAKRMKSEAGVS